MKPHKHAAVIIAWANGHAVEWRNHSGNHWSPVGSTPSWHELCQYRIAPKPDTVVYAHVHRKGTYSAGVYVTCEHNWNVSGKPCFTDPCNVKFTFDGETDQLKSVEIVHD